MRRFGLGLLFLVACGGDGTHTGQISVVPNIVAGVQDALFAPSSIDVKASALSVGSANGHTIQSLKYYIQAIQICQDVTVMGTGYSNLDGCISLYTGPSHDDYNAYMVEAAQADADASHYIDLMSAAGQALLRRPVMLEVPVADPKAADGGADMPKSQAGVYRYGLISFYRPIKVTATFPILGQPDQYYRTRAVTHVNHMRPAGGMFDVEQVEVGDVTSGPTEETVYMLNNGGVVFPFQKPFVVTQADVDARAEIKMDLVFNPESFGQAFQTSNCRNDFNSAICDPASNVVIDMPYVRMSPVPRKAGEKTRKETYLVDYDAGAKVRVELYYNDGDPEAGVQGVDLAVVYQSTATMPTVQGGGLANNYVGQTGSIRSGDASVTLMDYAHTPSLEGLRRRQSGTATIHCLFPGSAYCGGGSAVGGTTTRPYTFVGDTIVSAD